MEIQHLMRGCGFVGNKQSRYLAKGCILKFRRSGGLSEENSKLPCTCYLRLQDKTSPMCDPVVEWNAGTNRTLEVFATGYTVSELDGMISWLSRWPYLVPDDIFRCGVYPKSTTHNIKSR